MADHLCTTYKLMKCEAAARHNQPLTFSSTLDGHPVCLFLPKFIGSKLDHKRRPCPCLGALEP
eukprot:1159555-Pelagomonas_calceolata.AAC.1